MNNLLYQSQTFRIEHCDDCFIPGHLIIRPQKAVTSMNELDIQALENLGPMLALGYQAIQNILKPARIYTLSFCEVLPLLHFHLFPRSEPLGQQFNALHQISADSVNGALFFDWARKMHQEKTREYVEVNARIKEFFTLK